MLRLTRSWPETRHAAVPTPTCRDPRPPRNPLPPRTVDRLVETSPIDVTGEFCRIPRVHLWPAASCCPARGWAERCRQTRRSGRSGRSRQGRCRRVPATRMYSRQGCRNAQRNNGHNGHLKKRAKFLEPYCAALCAMGTTPSLSLFLTARIVCQSVVPLTYGDFTRNGGSGTVATVDGKQITRGWGWDRSPSALRNSRLAASASRNADS